MSESETYLSTKHIEGIQDNEDQQPRLVRAPPSSPTSNSQTSENIGIICTLNCGFPLVKKTAKRHGMTETNDEFGPWTLFWTDKFPTFERCRLMKRHQKTNHIPGILSICRKDELANNLNRMLKLFPKQYDFFPKTWTLPGELGGLIQYSKDNPSRVFIFKPNRGSLGRGIYLTKTVEHLDLLKMMIGQVYVHKPFLIDEFKFDLRLYVLISSCNPLRVYVYNEGLARFATRRYEPLGNNLHLKYMHLTNYSLNKNSESFVHDEHEGSKRKLTTIYEWLKKNDHNVDKLIKSIDNVIVKTILVSLPHMRNNYRLCFPSHVDTIAGFELLGFDFILDSKLKPYLLEVNHTPSLSRSTQLDREVKDPLIDDVFHLLRLHIDESNRLQTDEKYFLHLRLKNPDTARAAEKSRIRETIKNRETWEKDNCGNFRQIFPPNEDNNKYRPFLKCLLLYPNQDEFGELTQRQVRKNPYNPLLSETNFSDSRTMRQLLLSSYRMLENLQEYMTTASKLKLINEIDEARNNNWQIDGKFDAMYANHKKLFSKGMKSVLKLISKQPNILVVDKEKLSSIFLDPPTFVQENQASCIDLSDDEDISIGASDQTKNLNSNDNIKSKIIEIDEIDFIPGIIQEDVGRYDSFSAPHYSYGNIPQIDFN